MPVVPTTPSSVGIRAIDLISASARLSGFLASGEPLQGNEINDCLAMAQQMIDTFQADGLKIFGENINDFPLTVGKQSYTLGNGGSEDFIMPRPPKIQRLGLIMTSTNPVAPPERALGVFDYNQWSAIPVKNVQGSFPIVCYVEYNFPDVNLQFWQIPGQACSVRVYSWQPILTFPDLNTVISFPPAYLEMIKYNLAVRFAAEFKTQPDPIVLEMARSTMAVVKEINLPAPILTCDSGLSGSPSSAYYDWRSDTYIGH